MNMYVTYTTLRTKQCGRCLCLEVSHIWEVTCRENVRHIKNDIRDWQRFHYLFILFFWKHCWKFDTCGSSWL